MAPAKNSDADGKTSPVVALILVDRSGHGEHLLPLVSVGIQRLVAIDDAKKIRSVTKGNTKRIMGVALSKINKN